MTGQEIVDSIGKGMKAALKLSNEFLGAECVDYEFPVIRPEYLATVKVAENLTQPDGCVRLEAVMRNLRENACARQRLLHKGNPQVWLKHIRDTYKFGKRDGERLDILVSSSDCWDLPYLIVEIKLSAKNTAGIKKDIDRILKIMSMYDELGFLESHQVYGAVVFHSMEDGSDLSQLASIMESLVAKMEKYCKKKSEAHSWLHYKIGLITGGSVAEPVRGQVVEYEDDTVEKEFCRDKYAFVPTLILLGNATDIESVRF